ncbi:MAG TPA: alpha/beta hydrolase [Gammaproteobacteria bacterium]|nr:alpha/beta hydrolase [Gammaproteobacteria bacterium]
MKRRLPLLLVVLLLNGCTGLLFQPMKTLLRTPADIGLDYQDVHFSSSDGIRLHGWFLPAKDGADQARGTVLLLHGNAENISTHIGSVYWLPGRGFNVFLFDYRGYGQSQGTAYLQGAMRDIAAALSWLLANPDIDNSRIAVLGQSLGGAMGSYVFVHSGQAQAIRALILDSVFSDYRQIAREKLSGFWLTWPLQYPLSWLINNDYAPIESIGLYSPTPVLIIQGEADNIVPPHHAKALFDQARPPKDLWLIPGARHISALNQPTVRDRLVDYLGKLFGYSKNNEP